MYLIFTENIWENFFRIDDEEETFDSIKVKTIVTTLISEIYYV